MAWGLGRCEPEALEPPGVLIRTWSTWTIVPFTDMDGAPSRVAITTMPAMHRREIPFDVPVNLGEEDSV
jgi:hypothetical protein